MGRAPCCDKANVKKGPWSPEEDAKLKSYIKQHGTGGNWIALPQKIGLKRCGKSCRLRWLNYLRPNIKHGGFSEEEDSLICSLYVSIGSRWSIIAAQLPGRTDNDIKNYWNTRLKKKLLGKQGKEYSRRRNNDSVKKRDLEKGSIAGGEHSVEYPTESNSFSSSQIAPYWPEVAAAAQKATISYSNLEEVAFSDHASIRKLLAKLGGTFSNHSDQASIQDGPSSLHQYLIGQSSSSLSQNPNCDRELPLAMLPCATDAQPQLIGVEGSGITIPCMVEETQCFANPHRPLDGLEFLLGEGIEATCNGAVGVDWNTASSMVHSDSVNMGSSYGLGVQHGLL